MDVVRSGVKNRKGLEMNTRLLDVVEMNMEEVIEEEEEEEEEPEICTFVALNLDTGVEVSLSPKRVDIPINV